MNRRRFLAVFTLAACMLESVGNRFRTALAAGKLRLTPSQTEGPFYPVEAIPLRENLILNAEAVNGSPMWLSGRVLNTEGEPQADCRVEIWQCDGAGIYHHPNQPGQARVDPYFAGFGAVVTDAEGRYRFYALYPVPYTGRPPHIHVKVWRGERELLTTQLYLRGQTGNEWWGRNRDELQMDPKPIASGSRDAGQDMAQMGAVFNFVV